MWHSSTRLRHLASLTLVACAAVAASGCTAQRAAQVLEPGGKGALQASEPTGDVPAPPATAPSMRRGEIATIAVVPQADGKDPQTQIELVVDENVRAHPLEAGMFFRVVIDHGRIFKGLAQITEVVSPTRCIARQVGLTDRSRPLATGDQVVEVADLAALAAPGAVEGAARNQQLRLDQIEAADRRLFEAVRANYQQALADADLRHRQTITDLERQLKEQAAAAESAVLLANERHGAELHAATIAARAEATAAVEQAITAERNAGIERLAAITRERDQLRTQADGLLAQQQQHTARIEALVREQAERQRLHATQLRAEAETREVLQARLDEVEARLAGRPAPAVAVLTADPDHPETVLERLARVTRELQAERGAREKLAVDLQSFSTSAAELRAENAHLTARVEELAGADVRAREAQAQAAEALQRLAAAERVRDTMELARLEAERRLYDLSARVLRLTEASPAIVSIQSRLRDTLDGRKEEVSP